MVHTFCPICSCNELKHKYFINDFDITQCQSCKFIFVKDTPTQDELDCYYRGGMWNVAYLDKDNTENLKYYYRNLKNIITERITSGKILDIGCNAGYFLDVMEGFERYGIERSQAGEIAKERYGDNVFVGIFEEYKAPGFLFDCITMQDVLDHITDPVAVLKKCNGLLKPGGLLIVKVHDMDALYAKIMAEKYYAFIPPGHLSYFNQDSMEIALDKASFDIVSYKYMGHLLFISTAVFRMDKEQKGLWFYLYNLINNNWIGRIKVYKNLRDVMTVVAVKK